MNLLTDNWIPVRKGDVAEYISLKKLLCTDDDWQLTSNRDDMELAALQLIVCLVQVVFMPDDGDALFEDWEKPMDEDAFEKGVESYLEWFDLLHPTQPFMQIRNFRAEKTPIQKLFVGLPEGNNHAFFNAVGEVDSVSLPAAVVALFNQNSNAPGFSGKQKAGIRGATPITTLIKDESRLRRTVWVNVLSKDFAKKYFSNIDSTPVWIEPIIPIDTVATYIEKSKSKKNSHNRKNIAAQDIGFIRGLFWLPVLIELVINNEDIESMPICSSFKMGSDFYYEIKGTWIHPHSPRILNEEGSEYVHSFTITSPAWTELNTFLFKDINEQEGSIPALVVSQYQEVFAAGKPLNLVVGGYCNKQALILQRRHEMFSLQKGWQDGKAHLEMILNFGLNCKDELRKKTYGLSRNLGVKGMAKQSEQLFFSLSETVVHRLIRDLTWKDRLQEVEKSKNVFIELSREIFDQIVKSYEHDPKMMKTIVKSRAGLNKSLLKL